MSEAGSALQLSEKGHRKSEEFHKKHRWKVDSHSLKWTKLFPLFLLELSVFCETRWFCCDLYLLLTCKRLCFGRPSGEGLHCRVCSMLKDGMRFPVAINPVRFPATSYQPLLSLVPHGPILGILSRILPLSHAGAEEGPFLWMFCHSSAFLACHWHIKLLEVQSCGLSMSGSIWGPNLRISWPLAAVPGTHIACLAPASFPHLVLSFLCVTQQWYLMRYQEGTSAGQRALRGSDAVDIFGEGWYLR